MTTFTSRSRLLSLALVSLLSVGDVVVAQTASTPALAEDQRLLPYVKPGQLIDIGGRRINLHCSGAGTPTVVMMSGIASWSLVWYKVQPAIAQKTRVCGFDRANYGFSDPSPWLQVISDVVDDLHATLKAGSIPEPYVLVGHSLGGIEARLYTQRWPKEVAGMVLVDTSPAGEGLIDVKQPGFEEAAGRERYASYKLHCAALAARRTQGAVDPEFEKCLLGPLPADTPAMLRKMWPDFFTAAYFNDEVSLISSLYTHKYDSVDRLQLGAMPLVVLTPENAWHNGTPASVSFNKTYIKKWMAMHKALARRSSRGVHRFIAGSTHEIQLDKPEVVVDAVDEVLRQLQTVSKP